MPQIAQQDYIHFPVSNIDLLTAEEMKKLREFHQNGVLFDVILVVPSGFKTRIIAENIESNGTIFFLLDDGSVASADIS